MYSFIIRDYPDLDHIFPIIYIFLKNNKRVSILNFEINLDLSNDERIKFLKKNYNSLIKIIEIYQTQGDRFIDKILNFISGDQYKNFNFKNFKNIKHRYSYIELFRFLLIVVLKKYIFKKNSIFEKIIFSNNWASNFIKKNNIEHLILDESFYFNYYKPKIICKLLEKNKKKIYLVPHTCHMFSRKIDLRNLKANAKKEFYPTLILASKKIMEMYIECGFKKDRLYVGGSARFSPECVELYNNKIFPFKKNIKQKSSKINLLYIDGAYDDNLEKINMLQELSKFKDFNIVIKSHPRGLFQKNTRNKNFHFIDSTYNIETNSSSPTSILIKEADIIIGTYSSVLIEAMLQNKIIILPRFLIKDSSFMIFFEKYSFCKVFNNIESLKEFLLCKKFNLSNSQLRNIQEYLDLYVYGNNSKDNILNNYFELIK